MELFQILSCNNSLGTCCSDYSIVGIIEVTKKIFLLVQFVVPFILIIAGTIQFIQLTINPELKDGFRKVLNKIMAALIVFLLPTLVDVILTAAPESFSVASCWNQVKINTSKSIFGGEYTATEDEKSFWLGLEDYKSTLKYADSGSNGGGSGSSSTTGTMQQQIVQYAVSFADKGNKYKYGGRWNGSPKYTPTDCIGFVKGVYTHFGFTSMKNAPNGTQSFYKYNNQHHIAVEVSEKDLQPSDIVLWKGHIAIYIGKGKIVHAAGKKKGVITGKLYKGDSFRGFYRVKGVK